MRYVILLFLALAHHAAVADECRCKKIEASEFIPTACPTVGNSNFVGEAIPGVWFNSIDIDSFLSLMGDFSSHTVCLGAGVKGNIYVKYPEGTPWNHVVTEVASRYGYSALINEKFIYIFKP